MIIKSLLSKNIEKHCMQTLVKEKKNKERNGKPNIQRNWEYLQQTNRIRYNRVLRKKIFSQNRNFHNQISFNNKFISNSYYYNNNEKRRDHSLVKWEVDNLQLKCQNNHRHNSNK